MARTEHDREDLLQEATALIERAELQVAGFEDPVVAGFRRNGSFSVYFGGDPVYQFNPAGELRRAFAAGLLYKAERGELVALQRVRTEAETQLVRRPCGAQGTAEFLQQVRERLHEIRLALDEQRFTLVGQVPAEQNVVDRIRFWLAALPAELHAAEEVGSRQRSD
jgi:hypothetical protein